MSWRLHNLDHKDKSRWYVAANDPAGTLVCKAPDKFCDESLRLWPERAHIIIAAPKAITALRNVSKLLDGLEVGTCGATQKAITIMLDEVNRVILKSEGKGE